MAVESLLAVANQLQSAHGVLSEKLKNSINIPDQHSLDTFMQTVKASSDVRLSVFVLVCNIMCPSCVRFNW